MISRRGWRAALALAIAAAAGCEGRPLDAGPVGSTDAGTDSGAPPIARDGGDGMGSDSAETVRRDAADGPVGPCPVTQAPAGTFAFLSAGNDNTCGIRTDGTVTCWGATFYPVPAFTGTYKDVSRMLGVCAVRSSGALDCQGLPTSIGGMPGGLYDQVVIAEEALCARAGARVTCWGHAGYTPPGYDFEALTGGAYYMCGLEAKQHAAVCWEPRVGMETLQVQAGPFVAVDTGRFFACGLRVDGSVTCWADRYFGPGGAVILDQTPPAGPFRELGVGEFHACALDAAGAVTCWGEDRYGDTAPPAGLVLSHVSPGSYHTCGIMPDGTVVCWGGGATCNSR